MKVKIAVAHHKVPNAEDRDIFGARGYINIGVGDELSKSRDKWVKDNIFVADGKWAELNYTASELTHLNFLWENQEKFLDDDTEYIGLCHYRRRFDLEKIDKVVSEQGADIVCSVPAPIGIYNVYGQYCAAHDKEDFELLLGYIKETFWNSGHNDITQSWLNARVLVAPYNCFVMKLDIFNDFCDRLFPILLDLYEKRKNSIDARDKYQRRAIGFLGERYTSWYITQMALGQGKKVV